MSATAAKRRFSVKTVGDILYELEPILAPDVQKIDLLGLQRGRLQLRFFGPGADRFSTDAELRQAIEQVFQDNVQGIAAVDITMGGETAVPVQKVDSISREMNLGVIAANSLQAADILADWGLHCVGCLANAYDTVEQGARVHGMSDAEIDQMVDQVNKQLAIQKV